MWCKIVVFFLSNFDKACMLDNDYTLSNKVGFSTVWVNFLSNKVAERYNSVAGFVKIVQTPPFWARPPLSHKTWTLAKLDQSCYKRRSIGHLIG